MNDARMTPCDVPPPSGMPYQGSAFPTYEKNTWVSLPGSTQSPNRLVTSHNGLAIHPLPNELFVQITFELIQLCRKYRITYDRSWKIWDWIVLTHVCRRWRELLIDSALLWTDIDGSNLDRAYTFVERSSAALVSIRFLQYLGQGSSSTHQVRFAQLVQSTAYRTRVLDLSIGKDSDAETIFSLLTSAFPGMRKLSLSVPNIRFDPVIWRPSFHFPHLRTLSLTGVYIPFDTDLFRNLHHLELSDLDRHKVTTPSITTLLGILRCCPELGTLTLHSSGPKSDDSPGPSFASSGSVELSSLRELDLGRDPIDVSCFFSHVDVPPTASLKISYTYNPERHAFGELLPLLPRSPSGASLKMLAGIEWLKVEFREESYSPQTCLIVAGHDTRVLAMTLKRDVHEDDYTPSIISHVMPSIGPAFSPSTNLRELSVARSATGLTSWYWHGLLSHLPFITQITFRNSYYGGRDDGLLDALLNTNPSPSIDNIPCSNLNTLILLRVGVDSRSVGQLEACVRSRSEKLGRPMRRIDIRGVFEGRDSEFRTFKERFASLTRTLRSYVDEFTYVLSDAWE